MDTSKRSLLGRLPDDALHTEIRGLLRRRGTRLIACDPPSASGFVLAPTHELAVAYGAPDERGLRALAGATRDLDAPVDELEVHASEALVENWTQAGLVTSSRSARILGWTVGREAALDALVRHEVRLLSQDDEALDTLPAHLQRELSGQEEWPVCAGSFAGEAIASLAYAFVETVTHWDLSIDTLADFRREGFATSSAAFLMQRQFDRGLQPVWGADLANTASLALAARLGFEPVGTIGTARLRITAPER